MMIRKTDFPELKTERLILRRFTEADAEALFLLLSDPEVNRFLPFFPLKTRAEAEKHLREIYLECDERFSGCRFAVCLKRDNIPIGYVHVSDDDSHDLGYALRKEFWGMGIAPEAAGAVVEYLRKSGLPYITATHDVKNPRSGRVMEKIGMTFRYSYVEQWQPKNRPVTFRMYQLNLDGRNDRVYEKYRS